MTQTEPILVVIVSAPGRKLENLQNMLGSIEFPLKIETVENCQEALTVLSTEQEAIFLIDYRYPKKELGGYIRDLFLRSDNIRVFLLHNRNASEDHFTHDATSEVVYDDLSVGVLKSLLSLNKLLI